VGSVNAPEKKTSGPLFFYLLPSVNAGAAYAGEELPIAHIGPFKYWLLVLT